MLIFREAVHWTLLSRGYNNGVPARVVTQKTRVIADTKTVLTRIKHMFASITRVGCLQGSRAEIEDLNLTSASFDLPPTVLTHRAYVRHRCGHPRIQGGQLSRTILPARLAKRKSIYAKTQLILKHAAWKLGNSAQAV